MNDFKARRIVRNYTMKHDFPASRVFPLLCPVLEYDWIDFWECDLVYSDSGVAENNCIFITRLGDEGEAIWVCTLYDPAGNRIQYVRAASGFRVHKLDIELRDAGGGKSESIWTDTYTSLSGRGDAWIDYFTGDVHQREMGLVERCLNHYLQTGEKLVTGAGDWMTG